MPTSGLSIAASRQCANWSPDRDRRARNHRGKQHLQAMLQAVQTIRPALADFYNALSDEQKARFNTVGRQLFAER
ncbi:MAG TPA: Spy/CpxP family protein refolding chaperone [Rhizomicrobium sp.]